MAEHERERVGFFRQRWAQETALPQQSPPESRDRDREGQQLGDDVELSEVNAGNPVRSNDQADEAQKRSWRENLRFSQNRPAGISAPEPVSENSTSIRSPVDSRHNTAHSDPESSGENGQQDYDKPSSPDKGKLASTSNTPTWLTEIYTLSWLIFFSLLGTLARLGLEAITQYPSAPVTSRVLWANLGGSLLMGFLVEDRSLFGIPEHLSPPGRRSSQATDDYDHNVGKSHLKYKKTIPIYIGLTTGFCGSFTSFSSFIRDAFLALTNALPTPSPTTPYHSAPAPSHRKPGFSLEALLAILIIHPAVSLAALKVGAHIALAIRPIIPRPHLIPPTLHRILNPLSLLIGPASWLVGALLLTIFTPSSGPTPINWRARATIPLLFAPPGCILRYYLAKHLNRPSTPNFPWGTFAANLLGTLVLGMAWDLQHSALYAGVGNTCAVLLGVQEGFCGCLSTVSTWAVEINGLGRGAAWVYGGVSVGVALGGLVVVMGGMGWTVGFVEPVCG